MKDLAEKSVSLESIQFYEEVVTGLSQPLKELPSKYFYDSYGDSLFQQIMGCNDYYLTRCEMDIFENKTQDIIRPIMEQKSPFDLIELGVGDGSKTFYLLDELRKLQADFNYRPIDISGNILSLLTKNLSDRLPELNVIAEEGDYFDALKRIVVQSARRKVVLFLGSNIGNMPLSDSLSFCTKLSKLLAPGDLVVIGVDLKKNPKKILRAYTDQDGFTSQFNLNLLRRINRELDGDFDINQFEHYQTYDPVSGACKSYLISLCAQVVRIADRKFSFKEHEPIYMEVSQKFSIEQIDELANRSGFRTLTNCVDSKGWFVDTIWEAI